MLSVRVATCRGNDKILARKRKIGKERLSKTKQIDQMPSCSSSFTTWVSLSNRSAKKLNVDNGYEGF